MAAGLVLAARDMTAERQRAAALDRTHHLHLVEADVARVGNTPRRTMVAEDVRDLQSWTRHSAGAISPAVALFWFVDLPARLVADRAGSRRQRSYRWRHACSVPSPRTWHGPEALEIARISMPRSNRWVAKLCRNECSVTAFLMPAAPPSRGTGG